MSSRTIHGARPCKTKGDSTITWGDNFMMKFKVEKKTDDGWEAQEDMGMFTSVEVANEGIYIMLEDKSKVWDYRVIPVE